MTIEIKRTKDGYVARVTRPHCDCDEWSTATPLSEEALVKQMLDLGVHPVDMWDFIKGADRKWEREQGMGATS